MTEWKAGDLVFIRPEWKTRDIASQIAYPTRVLAVVNSRVSRSGTALKVRNNSGVIKQLDSGWFEPAGGEK